MKKLSEKELESLPPDGGEKYNRLIFEKSPYLLQHAENPVDWYPWGQMAFDKAREEDKPIFLSIGYSTCHWCHVMEKESFEDDDVALFLNRNFISIKIDREERPDIDNVYMNVCQMLTGSGGWPLTVFLTPRLEPFYAGTYFPKNSVYGRPGMLELLPAIMKGWRENRSQIESTVGQIMDALKKAERGSYGGELSEKVLTEAFDQFKGRFDERYGGFGNAPKFPSPHNLGFLLRYWKRSGEQRAREMALKTLRMMRLGGMYDHIGYGFHRYSTDRQWLVPHFEKMLYDQALLAIAYIEAFQATGDDFYSGTAGEILAYVARDMTSPEGGFYSAEDADSEGVEGKFYLWPVEEIKSVLNEEEAAWFLEKFNISLEGNYVDPVEGGSNGLNIPYLKQPLEAGGPRLTSIRDKLFTEREKRVHPHKDDKVLTDWNGLMIAAFALASRVFNDGSYARTAEKAAGFILESMLTDEGELLHRYRDGQAAIAGHLDDYSFLAYALVELYQVTHEVCYLKTAIEITDKMLKLFWDDRDGGFYLAGGSSDDLIFRNKEIYDGAIPSGNSMAALNMIRISRLTGNVEYENKAREILSAFSGRISGSPTAFTQMLSAFDFADGESLEVIIAGTGVDGSVEEAKHEISKRFIPSMAIVLVPGKGASEIKEVIPYIGNYKPLDGKTAIYICHNRVCERPTSDISEALRIIEEG
ncbi:MAG: DUF255 domain-containing protein [candidate division Zixibacteria bacterium]|nr:DUF255 domain-containing protein [candidate division Zixibacteria bacterium]